MNRLFNLSRALPAPDPAVTVAFARLIRVSSHSCNPAVEGPTGCEAGTRLSPLDCCYYVGIVPGRR
jgi:hypothetical protein